MKTLLHPLLLAGSLLAATIQPSAQDCGATGRYTANIFTAESITKSEDILFGRNAIRNYSGTGNRDSVDLFLNVYQSSADAVTNRPLVILAFGGGFIGGNRTEIEPIARAFAQKGYVVAAIDYRIVTNQADQLTLVFGSDAVKQAIVRDVIVKSSSDVRAAVRFFRHHAATSNTYRIDPTKIFVGGASAGAISSLQAAYVDDINEDQNLTAVYNLNGGVEGNTDLPGTPLLGTYNSRGIAGVINIAGAVLDTIVIDANDPPVYSAHASDDQVIPYESGSLSIPVAALPTPVTIPVTFYGSASIKTRADNVGVRNSLYTVTGGHEAPGTLENLSVILPASSAFMQLAVCATAIPTPVKLTSFTVKANRCAAQFKWQSAVEENSSHYEIESSIDGVNFTKVASVNSRNSSSGAAYSLQLDGAGKAGWYRLKMVDKDGSVAYSKAQRFTTNCDNALAVRVYPNPAQTKATVEGLEAGMQVDVLAADGRMLWSQRAAGNTMQLPVTSFAKGLLLIQVKGENGSLLSSTRLMKN